MGSSRSGALGWVVSPVHCHWADEGDIGYSRCEGPSRSRRQLVRTGPRANLQVATVEAMDRVEYIDEYDLRGCVRTRDWTSGG